MSRNFFFFLALNYLESAFVFCPQFTVCPSENNGKTSTFLLSSFNWKMSDIHFVLPLSPKMVATFISGQVLLGHIFSVIDKFKFIHIFSNYSGQLNTTLWTKKIMQKVTVLIAIIISIINSNTSLTYSNTPRTRISRKYTSFSPTIISRNISTTSKYDSWFLEHHMRIESHLSKKMVIVFLRAFHVL